MTTLEQELRLQVRSALLSRPVSTPIFNAMTTSLAGYKKAEGMIIRYAIKNKLSVAASIAQLEAELE